MAIKATGTPGMARVAIKATGTPGVARAAGQREGMEEVGGVMMAVEDGWVGRRELGVLLVEADEMVATQPSRS